jgi:plastocyanin
MALDRLPRRVRLAVVALGGAIVLTLSASIATAAETKVSIIQKTFQPAHITVNVGDTVTWTVTDAIGEPHSVTSGSYKEASPGAQFDSGVKLKSNGDSFSWTFTTVGNFSYFCEVHPDVMSGTVTVVAAGQSVPPDLGGGTGGSAAPASGAPGSGAPASAPTGSSGPSAAPVAGSGEDQGPISVTTKILAAAILAVAIVVLLGWAWLYRRVNR